MRLFGALLIFVYLLGCKQSSKKPDNFDYGKVENGVYKNAYFNMEVPFPAGWVIQHERWMEGDKNYKIIKEANKSGGIIFKKEDISTARLFCALSENPDSVSDGFASSVALMAENLGGVRSIKNGVEYLDQMRKFFPEGYKASSTYNSKKIGGKDFDMMTVDISSEGVRAKQLYFINIQKGFALALLLTFDTDEEEDKLMDILHEIKFK